MKSHNSTGEGIEMRGDRESKGKVPVFGTFASCLTSLNIKDPSMWARLMKLMLGSEEGFQE